MQQQLPQEQRITVAIEALGQAELHDLGWAVPATSDLRINRLIRSQQQSPRSGSNPECKATGGRRT